MKSKKIMVLPHDILEDANKKYPFWNKGFYGLYGVDINGYNRKIYIQGRLDERNKQDNIVKSIYKTHQLLIEKGIIDKDGNRLQQYWTTEQILNAIKYGFEYFRDSTHDDTDVPKGNKLQYLLQFIDPLKHKETIDNWTKDK